MQDTTIWNFEGYALYAAAPRIVVRDSRIYGAITNIYASSARPQDAVKFYNTVFENKTHPLFGAAYTTPPYQFGLSNLPDNGGVLFRDCIFISNNIRAPLLTASVGIINSRAFTLDNCTFVITANSYEVTYLSGGVLNNTRFVDETPSGLTDALIYTGGSETNVLQGDNKIDGTKIKRGDGNQNGLIVNSESAISGVGGYAATANSTHATYVTFRKRRPKVPTVTLAPVAGISDVNAGGVTVDQVTQDGFRIVVTATAVGGFNLARTYTAR